MNQKSLGQDRAPLDITINSVTVQVMLAVTLGVVGLAVFECQICPCTQVCAWTT